MTGRDARRVLIKTSLPQRNIASSAATGSTNLANWAPKAMCDQVAAPAVSEALRARILLGAEIKPPPGQAASPEKRFANALMGWPPPQIGEAVHDGFISEFGWAS